MPSDSSTPSLYGISESNSSRSGAALWGKNQFNSTFPLSLCLYMRDKGIKPVAVAYANGKVITSDKRWKMSEIVGPAAASPYYRFESGFQPFCIYSRNATDHLDIVVEIEGRHARALEVKLTVVPDKGTANSPESEWAPEMVMRPVSSAHAMMSIAMALNETGGEKAKTVQMLRSAYNRISSWDNTPEVFSHADALAAALKNVLGLARSIQSPFLLQPIWRTKGQSLSLKRQCFDVFVWSDVAVVAIPLIEHAKTPTNKRMTRWLREIARHVRSLYDILTTGDYDYTGIYKGMAHGVQTDKSFSLPGRKALDYLNHRRLQSPAIGRSVLKQLVGDDGANALQPERRFDAAVKAHML